MNSTKDGAVAELIRPQNLEELLKLLITDPERKKGSVTDRQEVELRAKHYHKLLRACGDEWHIADSIYCFMSELCGSGMDKDARLVADLLVACSLAYPDKKHLIIDNLLGKCNAYLDNAGEGIAIALLEINNCRNCTSFEAQMFDAFDAGTILGAMADSKPTPAGSGRLTNAIEAFIGPLWVKSDCMRMRRQEVRHLLMRWNQVLKSHTAALSKDNSVAPSLGMFLKIDGKHQPSFLEHFAEELSKRFFTKATLGLRLHEVEMMDLAYIESATNIG